MSLKQLIIKRLFDFSLSFVGIILTSPLVMLAWVLSSIETRSNGFFLQERIGKNGELFTLIKIKTMNPLLGIKTSVTHSNDVRITKSGAFFRKTKIDELPQLWNVLIGQMSFVGPRPDVPGYADKLQGEERKILSINPGITGPAQLVYKDEESLLTTVINPIKYNDNIIWPNKVKINLEYIDNYSFFKDLYYIWKTFSGGNVKY